MYPGILVKIENSMKMNFGSSKHQQYKTKFTPKFGTLVVWNRHRKSNLSNHIKAAYKKKATGADNISAKLPKSCPILMSFPT